MMVPVMVDSGEVEGARMDERRVLAGPGVEVPERGQRITGFKFSSASRCQGI